MTGTVSKHVTIVGELSNIVAKRHLLEVSEIEQEITCQNQHSYQLQNVKNILSKKKIRQEEAMKLVMLYALKYYEHSSNDLNGLINQLVSDYGTNQSHIRLIRKVVSYGKRRTDYFKNFGTQETVMHVTKRIFKDLQGVENIYTQHTPLLKNILEDLLRGNLKETIFPSLRSYSNRSRLSDVIVFVVGGVTYEESLAVHQLNCIHPNIKIILGGSTIHNATSFLEEVDAVITDQAT